MVCSYGGTQGDYNISLHILCAIENGVGLETRLQNWMVLPLAPFSLINKLVQVAHWSVLMVWRLLYRSILP